MKNCLTIIALLLFSTSFAQSDVGSSNISDGYKIRRGDNKGHPFMNNEWKVGYGVLKNGKITNPQLLNYDIFGNNLTYKTGTNSEIMVFKDNSLSGFIIKSNGNDTEELVFSKIDGSRFDKSKNENKYYQIIKAPSRTVIIEHIKELDDPNATGWSASSTNNKVAEYELKTEVYVLNKEDKYEQVKLRKKSILKIFKDKKKEVSNFIDSNNINVKDPKELVKAVEYYHSII